MHSCEQVAQVLQLVVQHTHLSQQDVASLLLLGSTIRKALQQAVGRLSVGLGSWYSTRPPKDVHAQLLSVTGFSAWLPQHRGLVQQLWLAWSRDVATPGAVRAAEQLVTFALQASTPGSGDSPAAAAGSGIGTVNSTVVVASAATLQLQSFHSSYVHNPAALHCLAHCSCLTNLDLSSVQQHRLTPAFCDALAGMGSLQNLSCSAKGRATAFPVTFAAALSQMPRLQSLRLVGGMPLAGLQQLPPSLTGVQMHLDHAEGPLAAVDLSHLSKLQELDLGAPGGISAQSQLPASLTSFSMLGSAEAVGGLDSLRYLLLHQAPLGVLLLQRLPELQQLQHVSVGMKGCTRQQARQVAAALGTGTQLTAVQMFCSNAEQGPESCSADLEHVQLHKSLCKLPRLQLLHLSGLQLASADVVHFTGLSSLVDFKLVFCEGAFDLPLAAMMQRLTGLQRLHLEALNIESPLIWAAAASLTNLEDLICTCNKGAGVTEESLHLLAPLTKLTALWLDHRCTEHEDQGGHTISEAAKRAFLSSMPSLTAIEWV